MLVQRIQLSVLSDHAAGRNRHRAPFQTIDANQKVAHQQDDHHQVDNTIIVSISVGRNA
jgi:hypothetical protein